MPQTLTPASLLHFAAHEAKTQKETNHALEAAAWMKKTDLPYPRSS